MPPEQQKNFLAVRRHSSYQAFSPTFLAVMIILGALILIGIVAAAWKLFPDLASQISAASTALPPILETPMVKKEEPKVKEQTAGSPAQEVNMVTGSKNLQIGSPSTVQQLLGNDTGIPDGATLGIIDCKLINEKPNSRVLRIAMKARSTASIDVQNVKIHVYFYDKTNDGEVVLTDSSIHSEWLSPPVDWSNGNPQILDVLYSGPPPPNAFYGYVVGIYYNNELQDSRAVPPQLAMDFPPPVFLTPEPVLTPAPLQTSPSSR